MDISSVDRDVVRRRLGLLRTSLGRLVRLSGLSIGEFGKEPDNFAIGEHHLRRAIEIALDVGRHIVARAGLGTADEYADVGRILGRSGIIAEELGERLSASARLRNRLVHLYWRVESSELHDLLPAQIAALSEFCIAVEAALRPVPPA